MKETLPLTYAPEAKCDIFLGSFLAHILDAADIDLLQRYLSQILEGINHSQTILVLTGDAGWGKSSLLKILGTMIGWRNVGIIREQLFRDELNWLTTLTNTCSFILTSPLTSWTAKKPPSSSNL